MAIVGTKTEVFQGKADRTSGGLVKSDLMLSTSGRVVSKARSAAAKKKGVPATWKGGQNKGQKGKGFLGGFLGGLLPF